MKKNFLKFLRRKAKKISNMSIEAKIKGSIREGINYLKKISLYDDSIRKNCENLNFREKYSNEYRRIIYHSEYEETYRKAILNYDYDILLKDGAIFQFSLEKINRTKYKLKYSYLPNPYSDSIENYKEFIKEKYEVEYEDVGEKYRDFFEQYVTEEKPNSNVSPIRYDYDEHSYMHMCHPVSHMHIGKNEDIRLPINYKILPEMFIHSVIMLAYCDCWKNSFGIAGIKEYCFKGKKRSKELEDEILDLEEKKIMYLN